MNRHRGLKIAELSFLGATLIGTGAAILFQQIAYALIPMTLTLLLSLINRQQWEIQHARQNRDSIRKTATAFSQLELRLEALSLTGLSGLQDLTNANSSALELSAIASTLEALHERQLILEQSVTPLKRQLEVLLEQFKKRPELVQIENLASAIAALQQFIDCLPQWEKMQRQQLDELQQQVERALAQLSTEIEQIPTQVEAAVQKHLDEQH